MTIRHPEKVNNPINPIKKKPIWIRTRIVDSQNYFKTKEIINTKKLHTVCQEASCPNISECWSKQHATFMIWGILVLEHVHFAMLRPASRPF